MYGILIAYDNRSHYNIGLYNISYSGMSFSCVVLGMTHFYKYKILQGTYKTVEANLNKIAKENKQFGFKIIYTKDYTVAGEILMVLKILTNCG